MLRRTLIIAFALAAIVGARAQLTLLDPSFGTGGVTLLDLSGFAGDLAEDVGTLEDGRILIAGMRNGDTESMVAVRLLPDGSLDPSFGAGGVAAVNFGGDSKGNALAVQADGAIVVAGHVEIPGVFDDLAFARFTAEGQLDTTFSGDGKRVFSGPGANDAINALTIAPDGRIVASGKFEAEEPDMVAVVLTPDGEPDGSFSSDGLFSTTDHTGELAETHVLRADGRLVLCGALRLMFPDADMAMLQLTPDGSPDPAFGAAGLFRPEEAVTVSVVNSAIELVDGRILITGRRYFPGSGSQEVFTGRITTEGAWDLSYGTGGRSFLPLGIGNSGSVRDMVLLPDGKALVAVDVLNGSSASVMALRVLPDGGLDNTFGMDGRVQMPCPGDGCSARSMALDAEDRVVVAGYYSSSDGTHIMVMRWLPEASGVGLPEAAGPSGYQVYPIPTAGELRLLRGAAEATPHRAELVDVLGRTVCMFNKDDLQKEFLMIPATVVEGTYVLRIDTSAGVAGIPVVVRR